MAKRRSEEEIRELLDEFGRSGLSGAEFAAQIGVSASTLSNWRRRFGACFLEVGSVPPAGGGAYVLDFGAVRLEVPAGFDHREVSGLVSLLREGARLC